MKHTVKITATYAALHLSGIKDWEIRENDRNYKLGDLIDFIVVDDVDKKPIGISLIRQIMYVFKNTSFGLQDGYCILSIKKLDDVKRMTYVKEV